MFVAQQDSHPPYFMHENKERKLGEILWKKFSALLQIRLNLIEAIN
jgi:hypothetical protein